MKIDPKTLVILLGALFGVYHFNQMNQNRDSAANDPSGQNYRDWPFGR